MTHSEELENETKADKFNRLAEYRMGKALKYIASIKQLANTNNYEWTPEQRAQIVNTLNDAVEDLSDALDGKKAVKDVFKFDRL